MPRFLPFGGAPLPLSWVSLGDYGRLVVQAPTIFLDLILGSSLLLPVLAVACGGWGLSLVVLRSFAVEVVTRVICLVLVGLPSWHCCAFCPPRSCGVPSLHVGSPVSGPVCVLPQSTIVTLLSLLWLGLLFVFVQFHCLRLTLWASACVGQHGCPAFSRVGADPSTWVPLLWPG